MSSLRRVVANQLQHILKAQMAELEAVRSERTEHLRKASELFSEEAELAKAIEETSEMIRNIKDK